MSQLFSDLTISKTVYESNVYLISFWLELRERECMLAEVHEELER